MIITFFYIFLSLFIWNEIYYIRNKERLDKNFRNKDIESINKKDLFFYFTKVLYWIWIAIGLFSDMKVYFIILLSLIIIKFPLYHLRNKVYYMIYDNALPILSIIMISIIILSKAIS